MNALHARRYPRICINDKVKTYKKPGKYGEAKESKSRWSEQTYTVENIKYGMDTSYKLQGLTKEHLRQPKTIWENHKEKREKTNDKLRKPKTT